MTRSRTYNTKRNFVSGIVKQVSNLVFPFVIRTIIIYYLGSEFQGISGLFSSILQMLSLADLGFSTAVVFALYKPVAEKNYAMVNSLINYLKKIYRITGIIVLGIGLSLLPFLRYLISGNIPDSINIYILYLIYLFNSFISYYLFAYKSALFNAMQREDVVSNINTITSFLIRIIQIILLFLFRNYYVFISVLPLGTITNNLLLQFYSKKMFSYIKAEGEVPINTKKELSKQIKALLISRIADVARNSLDNIVISSFIGLSAVAMYDNYLYIYTGIRGFILVLTSSMQASVGNSVVEESVLKNYNDLKKLLFLFMVIISECTTCLLCLYQPFMHIWMNNKINLILPFSCVIMFCIYFYEINICSTINLYLNANGLYWHLRYWYIIEALANLLLNIILGKIMGIFGILLATIITLFIFNFIPRIVIVFKNYFKINIKEYLFLNLIYFLICIWISTITYLCVNFISIDGLFGFIIKGFTTIIVSLLLYFLLYEYDNNLNFLFQKLKRGFK